MKRYLHLILILVSVISIGVAAEPKKGRGNANNPNADWVVRMVLEPISVPGVSSAFCSYTSQPDKRPGKAYSAQGDEGLDNAFDTSLCLVVTADPDFNNDLFPIILNDWPSECFDGVQWDVDPLPNEESCPEL